MLVEPGKCEGLIDDANDRSCVPEEYKRPINIGCERMLIEQKMLQNRNMN